jgi:thioredoxin 1
VLILLIEVTNCLSLQLQKKLINNKLKKNFMLKPVEITDSNFEEIINSEKPVLVDFWAEWCGPCKMIGPLVEELANEFDGKAIIGKVDVDTNPEVSAKFGIRSIPTLLVFKGGEIVDKQVGAVPKSVLSEKIEAQLA